MHIGYIRQYNLRETDLGIYHAIPLELPRWLDSTANPGGHNSGTRRSILHTCTMSCSIKQIYSAISIDQCEFTVTASW